jgi:hypothetical protein
MATQSYPTERAVQTIGRWRVPSLDALLAQAVPTKQIVRIRGTAYTRATLRGVPAKHADMIILDRLLASRQRPERTAPVLEVTDRGDYLGPAWQPVVEVASKAGRYDGAVRRRYALRLFDAASAAALPLADLRVVEDGPDWIEVMILPRDAPAIIDRWPRLRADLSDYELWRIWAWHYARYYSFLGLDTADEPSELKQHALAWAAEAEQSGAAGDWTLSEANQAASRNLYRLARDLGWVKLTLRERDALGMPVTAGQWHPEAEIAPRRAALAGYGDLTGCGEATLTAAATGHWPALFEPDLTDAEVLELEYDEAYCQRNRG